MRRATRAALLALLLSASPVAAGAADRVTLYTPVFQGPKDLAQSVATILNLQLWETLRAAPSPNPKGLSFGTGVVVWGRALYEYSHQQAENRAKEGALLAQLVFWGKVYEYGDGAVAETNLSIPRYEETSLSIPRYEDYRQAHPEEWVIHFKLADGEVQIEADIPQRRYSFRPIVLAKQIIDRYSQPMALEIRERHDGGAVIGHVGEEFTRLSQTGDMVELVSGGKRGWVHLPEVSMHPSEAVNFVGGMMRALRGDWQGVEKLMNLVVINSDTPNELRTDAYLYLGLAQEKQGKSGEASLAAAVSLSPNARRCVVYSEMGALSELGRLRAAGASRPERDAALTRAQTLLTENRPLFSASDPWPEIVLRQIGKLIREP